MEAKWVWLWLLLFTSEDLWYFLMFNILRQFYSYQDPCSSPFHVTPRLPLMGVSVRKRSCCGSNMPMAEPWNA